MKILAEKIIDGKKHYLIDDGATYGENVETTWDNLRTPLNKREIKGFDKWKEKLPQRLQDDSNYDLSGYFKKYGKEKLSDDQEYHLTDEFKLPNHPTFSSESKYYNDETKYLGGEWKSNTLDWEYIPNTDLKKPIIERKNWEQIREDLINENHNMFSRSHKSLMQDGGFIESEDGNLVKAKKEMLLQGITEEQRKAYVKDKSERAFNNITPQGYGDLSGNLKRFREYNKNTGRDKNDLLWYAKGEVLENGKVSDKNIYYQIPKRDDAFRLYLGMPQKENSFGVSDYKPTNSKNPNQVYFRPNYWSDSMKQQILNDYLKFKEINDFQNSLNNSDKPENKFIFNEKTNVFPWKLDSLKKANVPWDNPETAKWVQDNPLGDFTVNSSEDSLGKYMSIYDKWDLNPFIGGEGASSNKANNLALIAYMKMRGHNVNENTEVSELFGAGKPFEVYDRIYYDPETKKMLKPEEIKNNKEVIKILENQKGKKFKISSIGEKRPGGFESQYSHGGFIIAEDGKPAFKNPYYVPIQGSISDNTKTKLSPKKELSKEEIKQLQKSPTSVKNIKAKEVEDKNQRLKLSEQAYQKRKTTGIQSSQDLANETGAIGDKIALQNIPYVGKYIPNILDITQGIGNMASGLGRIPLNLEKGNYGQATLSVAMPLGFGALAGVSANTTGEFINNIANPLAGTGDLINNLGNKYLPNAYKLNPWAFKPNPKMMYRGIGKEGMEDALESGVFRAKQNVEPSMYNGFNMSKQFNGTYYTPKFETASQYGKGFIAEVPKDATSFRLRYKGKGNKTWSQISDENIPINKGRILEKDWLKRYKEVPKPTTLEDLVDLYRIQQKGAKSFAQLAAESKIPQVFNKPEILARKAAEEKYFGQWFTNDKNDLNWYLKDREFTNPEIINLKVPKSKLSQYQQYDKTLSRAPDREFVIPFEDQKIFNVTENSNPTSSFKSEIGNNGMNKAPSKDEVIDIPYMTEVQREQSALEISKGNEWMKNWYEHPKILKRLEKNNSFLKEAGKYNKFNDPVFDITNGTQQYSELADELEREFLRRKGVSHAGVYSGADKKALVFSDAVSPSSTAVHEGTHKLTDGNIGISKQYKSLLKKVVNKDDILSEMVKPSSFDDIIRNEVISKDAKYFSQPTEIHARLNQIRNHYRFNPETVVTDDMAKGIIKDIAQGKTPISKKFADFISSPEGLSRALNKMFGVAAPVGVGISMNSLDKKEFGGNIEHEYYGGELPEVTITAQSPKSVKDFTKKYSKKISDDYSGSLEGSLFVAPLMSILGLPQAAATYALSKNNELEPSKALNIDSKKNPVKAMVADIALDPINLLGVGAGLKGLKNLNPNEIKALQKAYKLNPFAFKPNPEAYYHRSPNIENIINKESGNLQGFGQSDAGKLFNETAGPGRNPNGGINLKKAANNDLFYSKGVPLDYGRYNSISKGMSGQGYPGPFLVESKGVPMVSSSQGKRKLVAPSNLEGYATSTRPINSNEVNFYKEHWLKGYKQIEAPKTTQNFKSEIDWGKWNKEIPSNKPLMDEYLQIEKNAKQNGTWMKYSDGSAFNGTPEQFVQMNSKNTINYAGSKKLSEDMYKNPAYRGAPQHIDDFANRDRNDYATFLTSDKLSAETYAPKSKGRYFKPDESIHDWNDGIYQFGIPKNKNTVVGNANNRNWRLLDYDENIANNTRQFTDNHNLNLETNQSQYNLLDYDPNKKYLSTDVYAQYVKNANKEPIARIDNVIDVMGKQKTNPASVYAIDSNRFNVKSLMYNNGMFDMTNPNIYKTIIGGVATGTLGKKAIEKKKFGGTIKVLDTKIEGNKKMYLIED